jgi:antitoxin YefM
MVRSVSYSAARQHLAALLDEVTEQRESVVITRRNGAPVALIAADELASLEETAHLLRSPVNAQRLLAALERALEANTSPMTTEELRRESGLAVEG